jgi:hypothetical protein
MQLAALPAGPLLASQTIDVRGTTQPSGATTMWATERSFRLAGALDAAGTLSAGDMPGLAVISWRGGYRLHDVHTASRTYWSTSPHGTRPPITRETQRSSVPFAAGNIRPTSIDGRNSPAVVRSSAFMALVDGDRVFVPDTTKTWAGNPQLVEVPRS